MSATAQQEMEAARQKFSMVISGPAKLRRPQSYISKYERGDRRLDVIEFLEIARAIKFDPSEILQRLDF